MVVIKCHALLTRGQFRELHDDLVEMAKTGVVLLPPGCELLNEVPPDTEVIVVGEKGE